jgi:ERF superfamily protein
MKANNLPVKQVNTAPQGEAELLIAQAIDKNVPVETMERLLAMRRELKAERAKEAYDHAMAAFQAKCPTIEKTKAVYEKDRVTTRYKYAPLDSIVSQIKGLLAENGFSYSINTIQDEKMLGVVCRITHSAGHSEETTFSVPIGSEGFMSDVQKYGARLTFCKRYAFCNAFGILTGDEDTDAKQSDIQSEPVKTEEKLQITHPTPPMSDSQRKFIFKLLDLKGKTKEALDGLCNSAWSREFHELNIEQAREVIRKLNTFPDVKKPFQFSKDSEEKMELSDPI